MARRRLGDADDAGFSTQDDMDNFYRQCDEDDEREREREEDRRYSMEDEE